MSAMNMTVLTFNKPKHRSLCSFDRQASFKSFSRSFYHHSAPSNCLIACSLTSETNVARRSGNFKPSIWDFESIQSLKGQYSEERYVKRISELKSQLRMMLEQDETVNPIDHLEFIDDLQRLGISYHFEDQIKLILTKVYKKNDTTAQKTAGSLYHEALQFRLMRQHGFVVSQDVFECFKNEKGEYKSSLSDDIRGLLQLYEASHMSLGDEHTLDEAREFSTIHLENYVDHSSHGSAYDPELAMVVCSSLEVPLHWQVRRPRARSFIDRYERKPSANHVVLEFAKLDFNILQAMYQEELKDVSRWWKKAALAEKLPFARDMLVECYFWTTGLLFEPQFRSLRVMVAKVNSLISVIDDIYDVHGTMEELEIFTDVVQRWDMETIDKLPHYMQVCFSALNNFVNDMAHEVLTDQSFLIVPYLRKSWRDLCNAFLQEAKWYSECKTPTVEEYIDNARVSMGVPTILTHTFFLLANPIENELVKDMYKYHDLIRWSGTILRLANDLGTSKDEMKRGDVSKCIQCYMTQTGASEGAAREYVMYLIRETWKKINKERVEEVRFPRSFVRVALNLGRMAFCMYQHGDGHGTQVNSPLKYNMESLLFKPIGYI